MNIRLTDIFKIIDSLSFLFSRRHVRLIKSKVIQLILRNPLSWLRWRHAFVLTGSLRKLLILLICSCLFNVFTTIHPREIPSNRTFFSLLFLLFFLLEIFHCLCLQRLTHTILKRLQTIQQMVNNIFWPLSFIEKFLILFHDILRWYTKCRIFLQTTLDKMSEFRWPIFIFRQVWWWLVNNDE